MDKPVANLVKMPNLLKLSVYVELRSREMMFGVVLRVIGSKVEGKWFLAVFRQKA